MSNNKKKGMVDVEAERSVIRQCIEGPLTGSFTREEALSLALSELEAAEHFSDSTTKRLFSEVQAAALNSKKAEISTGDVAARLESDFLIGSLYELCEAGEPDLTEAGFSHVIGRVKKSSLSRNIMTLCDSVTLDAASDPEGAFERLLEGTFSMARNNSSLGARHIEECIPEALIELEERTARNKLLGFRCGIPAIDMGFQGIQKKTFIVIGARPRMGKSLVVGQMMFALASPNFDGGANRVMIFSPEMTENQYIARAACAMADVDWDLYRTGRLDLDERDKLRETEESLRDWDIIFDCAGSINISRIRQGIIRYQPQVVIVDYLQLIQPDRPTFDEYRDVTIVSKALNAMKKEHNIAVIAAAQLNRGIESDDRKDKRPHMGDLRGTGQIEQDADKILFLYRDKEYFEDLNDRDEPVDPQSIDFICGKDREGENWAVRQYIHPGKLWVQGSPLSLTE